MSRELYDWLVREKIADGALIAKWRKPGYEILCSLLAIQKGNHNFGTTSHCRVPMRQRGAQQRVTPDVQTGCICCASGDGRFGGPIWWNTPLEETDEGAEQNRAVWGQGEEPEEEEQHGGDEEQQRRQQQGDGELFAGWVPGGGRCTEGRRGEAFFCCCCCWCCGLHTSTLTMCRLLHPPAAGPSRKRQYEAAADEEEGMDDEVKKRLAALKG